MITREDNSEWLSSLVNREDNSEWLSSLVNRFERRRGKESRIDGQSLIVAYSPLRPLVHGGRGSDVVAVR